jgi:hypothetical protein
VVWVNDPVQVASTELPTEPPTDSLSESTTGLPTDSLSESTTGLPTDSPSAPFAESRAEPSTSATPSSALATLGPPAPVGWTGAAMAVQSIRQIPRPILIALSVPGHSPIGIDLRSSTFVWDTPLEEFPAEPGSVQVSTYPIELEDPGFAGDTRGLDLLLWMIGLNAFPARATWLRSGDKYRLKRWPDYDAFPHTVDELRLIKTLAQGLMTVDKLAAKAKVSPADAQRVVNALSLMGGLRRIEAADAAPIQPPVTPEYDTPTRVRGKHVRRGS